MCSQPSGCEQYLLRQKTVAFLIGSRANDAATVKALLEVAERYHIPVATTLSGKGVFPERHRLALGIYGFSGHSRDVRVISTDELNALVVFGSDLNQRDSMNWSQKLTVGKDVIIFDDSFDLPASGHIAFRRIFSGIGATFRLLAQNAVERFLSYKIISSCLPYRDTRRAELVKGVAARKAWVAEINQTSLPFPAASRQWSVPALPSSWTGWRLATC